MDKNDEAKIIEMMERLNEKEKMYSEMDSKTLAKMLTLNEMFEEAFDPEEKKMNLWYYVSDWTDAKYLTNEKPTRYIVFNRAVYMSDGEVNIRVPKCMEPLFPQIKYEDEPVIVSITTSF